ncbi:hypothetical protein OBBRIDRAFT_108752 [Obba rivulosa]|uniref:Uncharacterized protein n=1 Tax=Obba rivulosa TaxID=1052685 RepID=A0A8E2APV8_9APHY|nr:hypothetical protein OBBRIDRAFT_108752 [Obba rivulosa]
MYPSTRITRMGYNQQSEVAHMPTPKLSGLFETLYGIKGILARSLGFSRTHNPRNLEFLWYPLWAHVLAQLFLEVDTIFIAPQFPVWLSPSRKQDEDEEGELDGEDWEADMAAIDAEEDEEEEDAGDPPAINPQDCDDEDVPAISSASSNPTVAEPEATSQIIDTAVISIDAETVLHEQVTEQQKIRYGGLRVDAVAVPLIVENKDFVHRHYSGEELRQAIVAKVADMSIQMRMQAAYILCRYPVMEYVYAIAAVGPYWCSTRMVRKVKLTVEQLHQIRMGESELPEFEMVQDTVKMSKWSVPLLLGTDASTARLNRLKQKVLETVVPLDLSKSSLSEQGGDHSAAVPQLGRAAKTAGGKKVKIAVPAARDGIKGKLVATASENVGKGPRNENGTKKRRSPRLAKGVDAAISEGSQPEAGPSDQRTGRNSGSGKKKANAMNGNGKK